MITEEKLATIAAGLDEETVLWPLFDEFYAAIAPVQAKLPEDWTITLKVTREEAYASLDDGIDEDDVR